MAIEFFEKIKFVIICPLHSQENLKMAMNSQLIVYFTCNEIKRVAKQEEQYQQGTTLDVIAETVRGVMTTTLRTRDVRRVHVLIHMLSFSYTLMTTVFNKVTFKFLDYINSITMFDILVKLLCV